jgi:regulator of RNase E activity RraA
MEMPDKYIEKFKGLNTYMAAYMRDLTYSMHPNIQALNSHDVKVIGRAFTVKGPDIYMNALESAPEGSVYVHANAHETQGVWCGPFVDIHIKLKGITAAVIDGGITNRKETAECKVPTFARFVSTIPALNRKEGQIQVPVVCGGVIVKPGDIILGDADGVVVIPREHEEEIYTKMDDLLAGVNLFVEIYEAEAKDMPLTQHEILGEMFRHKYEHPIDYWRYYEPWAAKWRNKWKNR